MKAPCLAPYVVARMEPSGLAFGKPKDRLREIRGGASIIERL